MLNLTTINEVSVKFSPIALQQIAAMTVMVLFGVFITLELLNPRQKYTAKPLQRSYTINFLLFILNGLAISLLSSAPLFLLAEQFAGKGLLAVMPSLAVRAVVSIILLDLVLYVWHRACHQWDCLWMFHRVHHNDLCLNSSTAFRIHFLEMLATTGVKAVYVMLMGIEPTLLLCNEILMTGCILFHHSNIQIIAEKHLAHLFIVPSLHRAHHSTERCEHDRNYGAILSIWDRLLGTYTEAHPKTIGITGQSPQTLLSLLRFGLTPLGQTTLNQCPANLRDMIAEAAYYKAEKRNFNPGNDLHDWLEAKAEILRQYCADNKNISA